MILAALVARSLSRARGMLAGVAALLAAFQLALVLQAASYAEQGTFKTLGRMIPPFIQRWLGDGIVALGSFQGMVAFGYFHPVVVLIVSMMAAFLASDPAADVEERYVDLLLARPVPRHWLVTRSALLAFAGPAGLALVMMTSTWTTMFVSGSPPAEWPALRTVATLAAHLVLVGSCVGGLSLLLSCGARRRAGGFAPAAIATVAMYFVNVLAASWAPARVLDRFSPFHYYQGATILAGLADPSRDLLVLGAATAALVAAAYWRFSSRDL
jgi:ABC-type transport system involved in multi-copper enzyme maturation permease subunit